MYNYSDNEKKYATWKHHFWLVKLCQNNKIFFSNIQTHFEWKAWNLWMWQHLFYFYSWFSVPHISFVKIFVCFFFLSAWHNAFWTFRRWFGISSVHQNVSLSTMFGMNKLFIWQKCVRASEWMCRVIWFNGMFFLSMLPLELSSRARTLWLLLAWGFSVIIMRVFAPKQPNCFRAFMKNSHDAMACVCVTFQSQLKNYCSNKERFDFSLCNTRIFAVKAIRNFVQLWKSIHTFEIEPLEQYPYNEWVVFISINYCKR